MPAVLSTLKRRQRVAVQRVANGRWPEWIVMRFIGREVGNGHPHYAVADMESNVFAYDFSALVAPGGPLHGSNFTRDKPVSRSVRSLILDGPVSRSSKNVHLGTCVRRRKKKMN